MVDIFNDIEHDAWGEAGKAAERFIDRLTDRTDIAVVITPDVRPADLKDQFPIPAGVFYPDFARININASLVFDSMDDNEAGTLNPNAFPHQQAYPRYIGTLVHEAGHARHTRWRQRPRHSDGNAVNWAVLLEETREERKILQAFPQYSEFIKTILNEIVYTKKTDEASQKTGLDRHNAIHTALLVCARETNGVLTADDVSKVKARIVSTLTQKDYNTLEVLWTEAQSVDDDEDFDSLYRIGSEIQKLVKQDDDTDLFGESGRTPCGGFVPKSDANYSEPSDSNDAEKSEEDGSKDSDSGVKNKDELPDPAMNGQFASEKDTVDDISAKSEKDIQGGESEDEKPAGSEPENKTANTEDEPKKQSNEEVKEQKKAAKAAAKNVKPLPQPQSNKGYSRSYSSPQVVQTEPTPKDIASMRAVMKAVQDAQFRDMAVTVRASALPPGRLQVREAMNREIQVASRQTITATPWKQTRRREVDNPPITLAIASDISGSMGKWQRAVSTYTWAFASAIRNLQGTVAAVAWNTASHEIVSPNKFPSKVSIWKATGGSSGCPTALKALDGMLNLSYGEGVRVAVVITDGDLPEAKKIQMEVNKLTRNGVIVVWLLTGSSYGGRVIRPKGATIGMLQTPDDFRKIVTETIIKALGEHQ